MIFHMSTYYFYNECNILLKRKKTLYNDFKVRKISFFPQAVGICKDLHTSDEFYADDDVRNLGSLKCYWCCCSSYSSSDLWVHVLMWFKVFSRELYYEVWVPGCFSVAVVGKDLAFEYVFYLKKTRAILTWVVPQYTCFLREYAQVLILF